MKPLILRAIVASTLLLAAAYASAFLPGGAPAWAAWLMVVGTAGLMVSTMALGAARAGRIGRLAIPFALVFVILVAGFGLVLALPPGGPGEALWLGLPARAAIVLYGVGLLPLFAVPLVYALTFEESTLSAADLERVRAAAAALRAERRTSAWPGHAPAAAAGADREASP